MRRGVKDADGMVRALFSGPMAAKDVTTSEIGAIKIALDVYLEMGLNGKDFLIIGIESEDVCSWFQNKRTRSWLLHSIFKEIETRLERVGNVSFLMAKKQGNEMASILAFAGVKRSGMFKAWW